LEPDPEKLFQRVIVAETAIFHRLHKLSNTPENAELRAIDEALRNLRRLIANAFMLPIDEETATNRPLRMPNNRSRPNRDKRQTQSFA
jgi:hypothetical protein